MIYHLDPDCGERSRPPTTVITWQRTSHSRAILRRLIGTGSCVQIHIPRHNSADSRVAMPRTLFLSMLVLCVLFTNLQWCVADGQGQKQPNIVLIMADDLGFSDLGCY